MRSLPSALIPISLPLLCAVPALAQTGAPRSDMEGVEIVRAFPDHPRFLRPLWFGPCWLGAEQHALVEQGGRIWVFDVAEDGTAGKPELFLDISDSVTNKGNEEGLLGLAFHPKFQENRAFYVNYSVDPGPLSRISEFFADEGNLRHADPESELVMLELEQPYRNHNGGDLQFGPDGMLYTVFGDGGAANDPHDAAQDLSNWLGCILRIDVEGKDEGLSYRIPPDNPFVTHEGARAEIWAFGLRNAWRFDFDPETGSMWTGDVGQNLYEEVDLVEAGGNYGWPLEEGLHPFRPEAPRGPGELVRPVLEYPRGEGISITGGVVCRGAEPDALYGHYLYADYATGKIWALDVDELAEPQPVDVGFVEAPSSFGRDAWGRPYVCSFDGRIYRMRGAPR